MLGKNVHTFLSPIFPDKAGKSKLKPVSRKLTLLMPIKTDRQTHSPLLYSTHGPFRSYNADEYARNSTSST